MLTFVAFGLIENTFKKVDHLGQLELDEWLDWALSKFEKVRIEASNGVNRVYTKVGNQWER